MEQLYQILAAILIGTAFGAVLSRRNTMLTVSSLVAVALGVLAIIMNSWVPIAIGLVIFLAAQVVQRDTPA
ncbi:hypothetical protein KVP09_12410 [Alcaligenaceae bacterium CGII-47]|nr:hypothetical protein [Alcaligenaceae bacterium CGII-47]